MNLNKKKLVRVVLTRRLGVTVIQYLIIITKIKIMIIIIIIPIPSVCSSAENAVVNLITTRRTPRP